jgi:glycosyltransferase involved in cell wall biosynthesis
MIFRVKDKEELQQQMEFVINEREASENLGQNARRIAIERFNLKDISKSYYLVLNKLQSGVQI